MLPPRALVVSFLVIFLQLAASSFDQKIASSWQGIRQPRNITVDPQLLESITSVMNRLKVGYDKKLRPNIGGPPVTVDTYMHVRSMNPHISDHNMEYSMDCYFRQIWNDPRLEFRSQGINQTMIQPNMKLLDEIWKPDTFFYNGRRSYLHTITYPNQFIRIDENGTIIYSARLTITAKCPLDLKKFPMDSQVCPLKIGSYGYHTSDVVYRWNIATKEPVSKEDDLKMAQFYLRQVIAFNSSVMFRKDNIGQVSTLEVHFHLVRNLGYYLLQFYLPLSLMVGLSWVAFWLNREASAGRITLGITTVLTTITIGASERRDLPKVQYPTAIDIYLLVCLAFVFGTLLEYAGVIYFTKHGTLDCPDSDAEETGEEHRRKSAGDVRLTRPRKRCLAMIFMCIKGTQTASKYRSTKQDINSESRVDKFARIAFPVSFVVLNFIYWIVYLYIE